MSFRILETQCVFLEETEKLGRTDSVHDAHGANANGEHPKVLQTVTKSLLIGPGKKIQQLRPLAALVEEMESDPSTPMVSHNHS